MSNQHPQPPFQPGPPMPPAPPARPARERKGHARWIIPTCTAVAGLIVGSASAQGEEPKAPMAAPTVTVTAQASQGQAQPDRGREDALEEREAAVAEREAKVKQAEAAKPAQPKASASFGDGTYVVGEDIQPGQYKTKGTGDLCYWARLKSTDGGFGAIIANNASTGGQPVVTIKKSDKAVETRDCGDWTRVR